MTEDANKLSTQAISISGDMVTATAVPHEEKRYTLVRWNDSSGQVEWLFDVMKPAGLSAEFKHSSRNNIKSWKKKGCTFSEPSQRRARAVLQGIQQGHCKDTSKVHTKNKAVVVVVKSKEREMTPVERNVLASVPYFNLQHQGRRCATKRFNLILYCPLPWVVSFYCLCY